MTMHYPHTTQANSRLQPVKAKRKSLWLSSMVALKLYVKTRKADSAYFEYLTYKI